VFIENILREADTPEPAAKPAPPEERKPTDPPVLPSQAKVPMPATNKLPYTKAIPLVRKAMKSIDPDGEWYTLGQLGQFIQRENPDFDPRTYGSAKLSDLLKRSGAFEVRQGQGNHLEVRRRD
jgi:hypothetical protein